jgi:GntR family transcriptional regulator
VAFRNDWPCSGIGAGTKNKWQQQTHRNSMHSQNLSLPAYRQIQLAIENRIRSGELLPGDPIESERALAKANGVSLMTARHSLKELEIAGLVTRRRAVGTFVAPPKIHFNKLVSFSEQLAVQGLAAQSKVLHITKTQNENAILASLGLPCNSMLIRLERLRLDGSHPFAVEVVYLSENMFPGILDEPLGRRSLFNLIETKYQMKIAYADEEADATAADPKTAMLLGVSNGTPLLRIRQVLYADHAQPIVHSLGLYRSDRHSLVVRRFR